MEVRRTVPIELDVTESHSDIPQETIDQYRDAAKKIRFKHLRSLHKRSDGDALVSLRMNAGMMTTSGF